MKTENETVLTQLLKLNPETFKNAIIAMNEQNRIDGLTDECKSTADAIRSYFIWGDTKQGNKYWFEVLSEWE